MTIAVNRNLSNCENSVGCKRSGCHSFYIYPCFVIIFVVVIVFAFFKNIETEICQNFKSVLFSK